ncbi:MAG: phosphatidate cytidylyltransferase [Phycisphaerales bacterium]
MSLSPETIERLWNPAGAFDHPVPRIVAGIAAGGLVLGLAGVLVMGRLGRLSDAARADISKRCLTWAVLAPAILGPILLGAAPTIVMLTVASLLCYREFARACGLFRERLISALVVLGIVLLGAAAIDNYYRFFQGVPGTGVAVIAALAVLQDRPAGYIQRVALGALALLLFGASLAHYSFLANDRDYRPILCTIIFGVQAGDILAYICGKAFGQRQAFPNTSPRKTLAGHVGSILLTTPLVIWLGHLTFRGEPMDDWARLLIFGLIVSVGGQLGDLILSSIKRDLGVKDLATTLPGHGGFSDRFNSSLLVAPAAFHLINFCQGIAVGEPARLFTN